MNVFLPSHRCLTPPSWGTPCDINAFYTSLKSTFSGLQFRSRQYRSVFIRLAVIASETRKLSRNSKIIWPYSSSGSSKVIDLGVSGKPTCDFLLVINVTLAASATVFEIFRLKYTKLLILPTPPLFDAPARRNPLEFMDETYLAKTRGIRLPYGENFIILTSTVFLWSTRLMDRRTDARMDGRAIA